MDGDHGQFGGMERNQSSLLRQKIEEEIVTGILKPGDRLDETSLAERFAVSRTPIREALQHLAASGLIEHRRHRGAIVSSPDPKRLVEMFEYMAELEATCGRLAARRMLPSDETEIKAALAACREAAKLADIRIYYAENERFHKAIYVASGNSFLADQAQLQHRRLAPFRRLQLLARNRMRNSLAEHERIVEALLCGDAELTSARLHAHVAMQGERFNDLMASIGRASIDPMGSYPKMSDASADVTEAHGI